MNNQNTSSKYIHLHNGLPKYQIVFKQKITFASSSYTMSLHFLIVTN